MTDARTTGNVLITIPISHFCEKARWALDRVGPPYEEQRHLQLIPRLLARRAGASGTVPALLTPDGVLAESHDIVVYADARAAPGWRLYPEDPGARTEALALERRFDAEPGPHTRRLMYFNMLPRADLARAYNCQGVPAWEQLSFPLAYPLLARVIARMLGRCRGRERVRCGR